MSMVRSSGSGRYPQLDTLVIPVGTSCPEVPRLRHLTVCTSCCFYPSLSFMLLSARTPQNVNFAALAARAGGVCPGTEHLPSAKGHLQPLLLPMCRLLQYGGDEQKRCLSYVLSAQGLQLIMATTCSEEMRSGSPQVLQDPQNASSCARGLEGGWDILLSNKLLSKYNLLLIEDWSCSSSSLPFVYAPLDSCSYRCPSSRGNF